MYVFNVCMCTICVCVLCSVLIWEWVYQFMPRRTNFYALLFIHFLWWITQTIVITSCKNPLVLQDVKHMHAHINIWSVVHGWGCVHVPVECSNVYRAWRETWVQGDGKGTQSQPVLLHAPKHSLNWCTCCPMQRERKLSTNDECSWRGLRDQNILQSVICDWFCNVRIWSRSIRLHQTAHIAMSLSDINSSSRK